MNRNPGLLIGVCTATLLISTTGYAVTQEWTRQLILDAETLGAVGFYVAVDEAGGIYTTGQARFESTSWDGVLAKFDGTGSNLWTEHLPSGIEADEPFGGPSSDDSEGITIDDFGNIFVTGGTDGELQGNYAGGRRDAILAKYDRAGNLQWLEQFGSDETDGGNDVAADGLGNVYVAGHARGDLAGASFGGTDAFLAKFNGNGNRQWIRQFGTSESEHGNGVAVDHLGSVFIAGDTRGSLQGTNAGSADAFLSKYNTDGDHQWTQQFGSFESDGARMVATDMHGNAFVLGTTRGDLQGTNAGGIDTFLAKFDGSGAVQWTRQIGTEANDSGRDMTIDELGNIYIAGYTDGNLQGTNAGMSDAFFSKFDTDGNLQWIHQFGTSDTERAFGIDLDGMGNLYISGFSRKPGEDPFLAKFSDLAVPEPTSGSLVCLTVVVIFFWLPGREKDRKRWTIENKG